VRHRIRRDSKGSSRRRVRVVVRREGLTWMGSARSRLPLWSSSNKDMVVVGEDEEGEDEDSIRLLGASEGVRGRRDGSQTGFPERAG